MDTPINATAKIIFSCSEHNSKEVELYCEECEQLICLRCAIKGGQHHSHELSEAHEELMQRRDYVHFETSRSAVSGSQESIARDRCSSRGYLINRQILKPGFMTINARVS